jgi:hypothetical protein
MKYLKYFFLLFLIFSNQLFFSIIKIVKICNYSDLKYDSAYYGKNSDKLINPLTNLIRKRNIGNCIDLLEQYYGLNRISFLNDSKEEINLYFDSEYAKNIYLDNNNENNIINLIGPKIKNYCKIGSICAITILIDRNKKIIAENSLEYFNINDNFVLNIFGRNGKYRIELIKNIK